MKKKLTSLLSLALSASMVPIPSMPVMAAEEAEPAANQSTSSAWQGGYSTDENKYEIYPVVQSITYSTGGSGVSDFTLKDSVNVVYETGIDQPTKDYVKEVLDANNISFTTSNAEKSGEANLLVGINDSKEIVDVKFEEIGTAGDLFGKIDAYSLDVSVEDDGTQTIAILGKDVTAAYYGVSTLKMMLSSFEGNRLLEAHIEDYAQGKVRGVIEGFYGGFNYRDRESQLRMLRDVKGNLFMFASKTDPYHYNLELYPEDELADIAHMAEVGLQNKVHYGWSFHVGKSGFLNSAPGTDEYNAKMVKLKAKIDQLYNVGIRDFHFLNDDYNSGTYAQAVTFINEIDNYIQSKEGTGPLVYCLVNYNESWAGGAAKNELPVLAGLNEGVYIYWTGTVVNSEITQSTIDYVYDKSNHEPVTWINYPCSEHDKSGIYLGSISQYISNGNGMVHHGGVMSNPVNYAEANKVAFFQLMSWSWNNQNYTDYMDELWEASFKYLQPEVYDSYLTIARNLSNCPTSGRWASFPESEYLKETLAEVQNLILTGQASMDNETFKALYDEFVHINSAVADFRANCTNEELLDELDSWLNSLNAISRAGIEVMAGIASWGDNDADASWSHLAQASSQLAAWDDWEPREYTGIGKQALAGSLRLQPFVETAVNWLSSEMRPLLLPHAEITASVIKSFAADGNSANMIDGSLSTAAAWNVDQVVGDYYGLDLGKETAIQDISLVQGNSDTDHDWFHQYVVEYSSNRVDWTQIGGEYSTQKLDLTDLDISARYIRVRCTGFYNASDPSKVKYWTHVRELAVNTTVEKTDSRIYTNTLAEGVGAAVSGNTVSLTGTSGLVLNTGNYIGIKLDALDALASIAGAQNGLVLEYSENSVDWKDADSFASRDTARYVRLINKSDAPVTVGSQTISLTIAQPETPEITTNIETLKTGSWSNLIDGSKSTYVWTGVNQEAGQWIQVDMKQTVPFNSLSLYMHEERPRLYHGDIKVSADGVNWKLATTVNAGTEDNTKIDGALRWAGCNGDQSPIRYIRIEITDSAKEEPTEGSAFLCLYELQVNGNQITAAGKPSVMSGSQALDYSAMIDEDLSTFAAGLENQAGYLEYQITDRNNAASLTVIQAPGTPSNAVVKVLTDASDEFQDLGMLDKSVTTLSLPAGQLVKTVRIEWDENTVPAIYEMYVAGEKENSRLVSVAASPSLKVFKGVGAENLVLPETVTGLLESGTTCQIPVEWNTESFNGNEAGTYTLTGTLKLPEDMEAEEGLQGVIQVVVGGEAVRENLALNLPAASYDCSGSEDESRWPIAAAFDGLWEGSENDDSRWSGSQMKGVAGVDGQAPAWLSIDLGRVCELESFSIYYHRIVYFTEIDMYVSGTGEEDSWVKVNDSNLATLTDQPLSTLTNNWQYRDEDIALPAGTQGRYVKFVFNKMNTNGANFPSVRELMLFGKEVVTTPTAESVRELEPVKAVEETAFADLKLPETAVVVISGVDYKFPVVWSEPENYSSEKGTELTVSGTVTLPEGVKKAEGFEEPTVSVSFLAKTDKTQLTSAVSSAQTVADNLDAWRGDIEAFQKALANANKVLEDPASLQEDIDAAAAALSAAQNALVARTNLALNRPVTASGNEVDDGRWLPEGAVDGSRTDDTARWSSNYNKGSALQADGSQSPSWITVDLGQICEIDQIDTYFFKKVYATDYQLRFSTDGQTWMTLDETLGLPADPNTMNPSDSVVLENPVNARYVQFYCNEINVNAGGHALSIWELEVYGYKAAGEDMAVTAVTAPAGISVEEGTAFEDLELPATVDVVLGKENLKGSVPVSWSADGYDGSVGTVILKGTLEMPEGCDANGKSVVISVDVTPAPVYTVDTELLEVVLGAVKDIDKAADGYAEKGWSAFDSSRASAASTLEAETAKPAAESQTRVDNARKELNSRWMALRLIPSSEKVEALK